jgi:hypothetical protein
MAEAQRFFEAIGLECILGDTEIPPGIIEPMIGLPPGHRIHESVWGAKDRTTVGLELLEISPPGEMMVGKPPDTGFFMLSFNVDSVSAVLSAVQKAGFAHYSGAQPVSAPGMAACAVVEGFSGMLVLLQEKSPP